MKKEDGRTPLSILVTLAIAIIICGVIIAMLYQKPSKVEKNVQNIQTNTSTQENNNKTNDNNNIN